MSSWGGKTDHPENEAGSMDRKAPIGVIKIISGGQTGADRGALDFAIQHDIPHGGWVPKGRRAEDGRLPDHYQLREMPAPDYSKRTEKNVLDGDGTVILSHGVLTGGSALTAEYAEQHGKPWIHLDLNELSTESASMRLVSWIERNHIRILNVAGPRADKDPTIYQATLDLLEATFLKRKIL
jgi:hypothetical protein